MLTYKRLTVMGAVLGLLALGACGGAAEESARGVNPPRGLGKADGSDSCKANCGGQAPAGCWCDDQCATFGDCCADKKQVCDGSPGTCQGSCGKKSPDGCWCDAQCSNYGDCCADKQQVCDAQSGGCLANGDCKSGEYCSFADGCGPSATLPPVTGQCKPRPEACYEIYAPVCGCDGKTYSNDCHAAGAGTNVKSKGACDATGQFCGGIAAFQCPPGYVCELEGTYPDAGGKCVKDPTGQFCGGIGGLPCPPGYVCQLSGTYPDAGGKCVQEPPQPTCYKGGCSGQVCSDKPDVVTTCEWLPWYECFQLTKCGNFGDGGGCGWAETPEYVACMVKHGKLGPDKAACEALDKEYKAALKDEKQCSPFAFAPQCAMTVNTQLKCMMCPTFVNSTAKLDALKQKWTKLGCNKIDWICPAVMCAPLNGATCEFLGSPTGMCKDDWGTP